MKTLLLILGVIGSFTYAFAQDGTSIELVEGRLADYLKTDTTAITLLPYQMMLFDESRQHTYNFDYVNNRIDVLDAKIRELDVKIDLLIKLIKKP